MLLGALLRAFLVLRLESADIRWTQAALWAYLRNRPKVVAVVPAALKQTQARLKRRIDAMYPF